MCVSMDGNETSLTSDKGIKYDFLYDHSLWSVDPEHPDFVDQEKLYKLLGEPLLNSAFQGYNTCLFAYGQVSTIILSLCSGPLIIMELRFTGGSGKEGIWEGTMQA